MKTITLLIAFLLTAMSVAQNVYDVTPGTKGNKYDLTLANLSGEIRLKNVEVSPTNARLSENSEKNYLNFSVESKKNKFNPCQNASKNIRVGK